MDVLEDYGWNEAFAAALRERAGPGQEPARVVAEHRDLYRVQSAAGERAAKVAGRLRHESHHRGELPAVGDWVLLRDDPQGEFALIQGILPRRSRFSRKLAGEVTGEQVVAANIDTVWIVGGLDQDLNLRRLERYLTLAWESGAMPVMVLTKSDLHSDPDSAALEVAGIAPGVAVYVTSAVTGQGIAELAATLAPGRTVALLGSSGVGKSTLINALAGGELMRTGAVSDYRDKGRHTTTHRQLIRLPSGALLVDTPGMRELQLWEAEEGMHDTFADVDQLAGQCRYADCRHQGEPGCAVAQAVADGRLDAARLASYHKLQRELAHLDRRQDARARAEEERRWREIHRSLRHHPKYRR